MFSFYLEIFFVHIDPSPCALHIMCCAFFMKFQDNICRNKVEINNNGNTECIHLELNIDRENRKYAF